jgi:hypothetical protein
MIKFLALRKTLISILIPVSLLTIFSQCTEDEVVEPTAVYTGEDLAVFANATASSADCSTCNYIVPANKSTIDGKTLGIQPGWVICLQTGVAYQYLTFNNIVGSETNPVIITNCGGEATITASGKPYVVKITNSKYFRVTGGTVSNGYGIKIKTSSTNGLILGPLSTNFEIDHLEVSNVGFAGIMAKTDPTCDDATVRGNFTMRDVYFHHNYVHDTGGEGFYIGHTSYNGINTSCGFRYPHTIEGVEISNNLVKNSGWDGIQLSSAPLDATIAYNTVQNYSVKNNPDQQGGITLGGGTGGVCNNNIIKGGYGPGMVVFGLADNLIHNNIICNAGTMGIFCDERTEPGKGYTFLNNTIISPGGDGLRIYAEKVPMNVFSNNIVVNPKSGVYVAKLSTAVNLQAENNYQTQTIDELKFVNAAGYNFRVAAGSPVINQGKDVSAYSITKDYYKASRFKGGYYDIGAAEY